MWLPLDLLGKPDQQDVGGWAPNMAVSHVVHCPYCIDAYTKDGLQRGIEKEEMMEAVHVGAAIKSGAVLVHGVQMMNRHDQLSM